MNALLGFLESQGPLLLYLFLGLGSALENLFPPVPADTFVLLGAILAAGGRADAWTVFLVTWLSNTAAALLVFWTGHKYGRAFFQVGMGRKVLNPHQLRRLGRFYDRWGLPAIFLARFLPGLRAMVPVFAGVTRQGFWRVSVPILVASGIWYGGLVWLGAKAGRSLPTLVRWLAGTNRVLLIVGLVVVGVLVFLWVKTRGDEHGGGHP